MEASAAFSCTCGDRPRVARTDLLDRSLGACRCGAALATPCSYVDLERRQAVRVEPPSSYDAWRTLERTAVVPHGSPHAVRIARELRCRLVFGLEDLREKLVLWSQALDDAVIECVKLRAFTDTPELASSSTRITVDRVADDDTLTCHWSTSTLALPGTWVRRAHRDRESLERRFPELFARPFVDARRYLTP